MTMDKTKKLEGRSKNDVKFCELFAFYVNPDLIPYNEKS